MPGSDASHGIAEVAFHIRLNHTWLVLESHLLVRTIGQM